MLISLIYVILAALGLGLLVFIHELGHYFMARRVGMKVESFGIGFGKSIYSWEHNGVQWRLNWLPFGGYVKIAGMETEGDQNPEEIPGGFFSKSPIDRIKVIFAGPFVNLVFAFLIFAILWLEGGREKNFSEFTPKIGWVDPKSELYHDGVRPGDDISSLGGEVYKGAQDLLYAPMTASDELNVKGFKIDYRTGSKVPFDYKIKPYANPSFIDKGILTSGILKPASYLIYNPAKNSSLEDLFSESSPMLNSGILPGDRLMWVDGNLIFSMQQLEEVLNDGRALLTIQRGEDRLLRRVPRVKIEELKLDPDLKEEFVDWQHEAELAGEKISKIYAIPYNMTPNAVIENALKFIDKEKQLEVFPKHPFSSIDEPLKPNDKIIAVDGVQVKHAYQLLYQLQTRKVNIIVERGMEFKQPVTWEEANAQFNREVHWADLQKIASGIGTSYPVTSVGNLHLLKPIIPKKLSELSLTPDKQALLTNELNAQRKRIESIEDSEKRTQALRQLEIHERQLILGLPGIQDRQVTFNPNPIEQFGIVFKEIWRTMIALFTGSLSPKWMAGPIGIVQIVHSSWLIGFKEALFWIGAISLNLGFLNLLPIPVLDGGYIFLFLAEIVTKKKMKPKTLERLIIPFVILVVGFILYTTYNDVVRLVTQFFN